MIERISQIACKRYSLHSASFACLLDTQGGERKAIERQATEGEVNSEDKTHNDLRYWCQIEHVKRNCWATCSLLKSISPYLVDSRLSRQHVRRAIAHISFTSSSYTEWWRGKKLQNIFINRTRKRLIRRLLSGFAAVGGRRRRKFMALAHYAPLSCEHNFERKQKNIYIRWWWRWWMKGDGMGRRNLMVSSSTDVSVGINEGHGAANLACLQSTWSLDLFTFRVRQLLSLVTFVRENTHNIHAVNRSL